MSRCPQSKVTRGLNVLYVSRSAFVRMLTLSVAVTLVIWTLTCSLTFGMAPKDVLTFEADLDCDLPPSVWCSSREVARRCQVEYQCERLVWGGGNSRVSASPVRLGLYLESLCPDCKDFINKILWPAWKQLSAIMDLDLIPYGNAIEQQKGDKWEFTCQHGPEECTGNVIETCAIHLLKNATSYFPFVHCIEVADDLPVKSAPMCAKQLGIDYTPIRACAGSSLGNALEHKMAQRTDNLNPPHTFVPWITLNGVHTDEIQSQAIHDLVKLICDTYRGPKPEACKRPLNVHHMDTS